jgi:hypothetical protein
MRAVQGLEESTRFSILGSRVSILYGRRAYCSNPNGQRDLDTQNIQRAVCIRAFSLPCTASPNSIVLSNSPT